MAAASLTHDAHHARPPSRWGGWLTAVAFALGFRVRPFTAARTPAVRAGQKPAPRAFRNAGKCADVIVALHGIMMPGDKINWTERFLAWSIEHLPQQVIWTQNYWRWPTPRWNWIPNWFRARKLARWIAPLIREGHKVHFVGHSNGATIALATIKRLVRDGLTVESALFVAGAMSPDIKRSGVQRLIATGKLRRACAWWSRDDHVTGLPSPLLWPYGRLGACGFRQRVTSVDGRIKDISGDGEFLKSIEHPGYGHRSYFAIANSAESFAKISRWVRGLPFVPKDMGNGQWPIGKGNAEASNLKPQISN